MPRSYQHVHPPLTFTTEVGLETVKGTNYREAFAEAVHVASKLEREILLTFNGVSLKVTPTSTVETLAEEFCAKYLALRSTQVST